MVPVLRARRLAAFCAATAVAGLVVAAPSGSTSASGQASTVTVRVDAKDFSFALSRRSVTAGSTVRFVVRNRGATVHDFVIRGKRTRKLGRGQSQMISVPFPRKGSYSFLCSLPGHARLGMRGTFSVGKKPAPPPAPSPPVTASGTVVLSRVATTERPVLVTSPPGDRERIFVVDQTGAVWVVRNGEVRPQPFLDLRGHVRFTSEPGLLSIAFPPDYAESGLFYVFYNAIQGNGDIRIAEYRRHPTDLDLADPYSERIVLTIQKPWETHNGGMLQFGPDGYLYVSVGDGDDGVYNKPGRFGQSRDELLGNVLRIDPRGTPYAVPPDNPFVAVDGVRPEIWAYGLRNPWRFWIDHVTGDMYIGDAGRAQREEVDLLSKGAKGLNFGWPCFEGTASFDQSERCVSAVAPLVEIPREGDVCAIIGGLVVRDQRLPQLVGRYLYGDFCAGRVTAIGVERGAVVQSEDLGLGIPQLTSFGVDGVGRVYLTTLDGGVYRLDPKP